MSSAQRDQRDLESGELLMKDEPNDDMAKRESVIERYKMIEAEAVDGTKEGVAKDVWTATMLVIFKDLPDFLGGHAHREQVLRSAFISISYILNVTLQVSLTVWIVMKITLPSMKGSQEVYAKFHQVAFTDDGVFDPERFHSMDSEELELLCNFGISKRMFLWVILFLWLSQCLQEFKNIERLQRRILSLPALPRGMDPHDMVSETLEAGKDLIVCIDFRTKVAIFTLIIIPKAIICMTLLFCGSQWLIASESSTDLVLNSLALVFVVQIDELIYTVYLPARMDAALEQMKFVTPINRQLADKEREAQDITSAYMRSFAYLFVVMILVAVVIQFQMIFPGYSWDVRGACADYVQEHPWPKCLKFPWEDNSDCFPKP
jgi:hypothetical protein